MSRRASFGAMLILLGALCSAAPAQELADEGASFVINLRDADIRALSEQVSEITGRTLVLDPTVTGNVTVISAEQLTQQGVWDLFQSVLRVQGFAALRSGTIWRVVPQAVVREGGGELGDGPDAGRFDVVTRLVQLDNFPSATAVAALRPLVASFGYIEALPETNTLVVTDTVENVDRIEAIARSLDEGDGTQLSTIPVRNVDASEIATALTRVLGAEGGLAMRVAIDARNNVLLVRGSPELTDRVRLMVADLDQPGRQPPALVPVTRVYRLRYADAASMAEVLRGVIGAGAEATVQNAVAESLYAPGSVQEPAIANRFDVPQQADAAVGETQLSFERPPVTSLAAEDIIDPAGGRDQRRGDPRPGRGAERPRPAGGGARPAPSAGADRGGDRRDLRRHRRAARRPARARRRGDQRQLRGHLVLGKRAGAQEHPDAAAGPGRRPPSPRPASRSGSRPRTSTAS